MKLDIKTGDDIVNLERVEYFEVRSYGDVYYERGGESDTIEGEIAGGRDL